MIRIPVLECFLQLEREQYNRSFERPLEQDLCRMQTDISMDARETIVNSNPDQGDKKYLLDRHLMSRDPVRRFIIVQFNELFRQSGEVFWINGVDNFFL